MPLDVPNRMYLVLVNFITRNVDGILTAMKGADALERDEVKKGLVEDLETLEQVVRSTNNTILIEAYERAVEAHGEKYK